MLGGQHSFPVPDQLRHLSAKRIKNVGTQCRKGLIRVEHRNSKIFDLVFDAAARAIGVPGLHPHELRHTAADQILSELKDMMRIV